MTQQVLFSETCDVSVSVDRLDTAELSRAFSPMMDRAAEAVFRAGFDLDDVIVERTLVCQSDDGVEVRVAAEPLSNPVRLREKITAALGPLTGGAMIRSIVVKTVLENATHLWA